jgi:hypothetical protein
VPLVRVASNRLVATKDGVALELEGLLPGQPLRGTVKVTSLAKAKVTRTRSKVVSFLRLGHFTLGGGQTDTLSLPLSTDGKAALRLADTIRVRVTVQTDVGGTVTRDLVLGG